MEKKRFIEGVERSQSALFPERLEDYIAEDNPVRVIDGFVEALDFRGLGFESVDPSATGCPGYHRSVLLKLYIYGYLNRVQSSRRVEREAQCNVEVMWLTRQLMPDHKTISDFRKNNGKAIVGVYRRLELFSQALVAIDGSKFKGSTINQRLIRPRARSANGTAMRLRGVSRCDPTSFRVFTQPGPKPDLSIKFARFQDRA